MEKIKPVIMTKEEARQEHANLMTHALSREAAQKALEAAQQAGNVEDAAMHARRLRDMLLTDVDAHGSVYRLELEAPDSNNFMSWLPVIKKIAGLTDDEWGQYRRHLLDVPQQEGFPMTIDWPVKPEK